MAMILKEPDLKSQEPKESLELGAWNLMLPRPRGFALLIAVIFMSVMLSLGLALGSLAYKQQVLASGATESQYAFYAADAALECALYADQQQNFFAYLPDPVLAPSLSCGGATIASGYPPPPSRPTGQWVLKYRLNYDEDVRCADVTVYKPASTGITYIFSQGYDVSCATVASPSGARFVSRGLSTHYSSSAPSSVNGACGSANGVAVSSAPATNLCSAGTASAVSGTGPWTWSCNGSGSGTNASCSAPSSSCPLPWGGTIANGQSATAYLYSSVSYGDSCANYTQTRTCTNGTLSGSYTNQSCSVEAAPPPPPQQVCTDYPNQMKPYSANTPGTQTGTMCWGPDSYGPHGCYPPKQYCLPTCTQTYQSCTEHVCTLSGVQVVNSYYNCVTVYAPGSSCPGQENAWYCYP